MIRKHKRGPLPFNASKKRTACPGCSKWEFYSAVQVLEAAEFWTLGERERCLQGFCPDHEVEFAAAMLKAEGKPKWWSPQEDGVIKFTAGIDYSHIHWKKR